jgi:hypothetical protein
MKKVWEVIKKIFMWFGALFVAIFTVLFVKERIDDSGTSTNSGTTDVMEDVNEINAKAAKKREEAVARIERADARSLSESYGSVCDAISDGKERFRRRCARADN